MEMIVFVGLQGSGKTTYYERDFRDTHLRINLDMLKTRRREAAVIDACLSVGQRFVVDNTNPGSKDREIYLAKAKAHHFKSIAYFFDVPFETCKVRNRQRATCARIPDAGLRAVATKLEKQTLAEGFAALYHVDTDGQIKPIEQHHEI